MTQRQNPRLPIANHSPNQATRPSLSPFPKELGEECGVIAIYRNEGDAAGHIHRGLFALQHRGQESAGICVSGPDHEIRHLKGRGLVAESLPTYDVKKLVGNRAIGHVRYSTVTADRTENIQPFVARLPYGHFAVAHNGNLGNAAALKAELEERGSLLSTSMDTELMVHLIARSEGADFLSALKTAAGQVVGAYSLTMLFEGRVFALRDPHGVRPLVLGKLSDGWVVASETCALTALDATYVREIEPGELVEIGPDGVTSTQLLPPAPKPAPCVFELVYFARPNSEVFGQSVHRARTRMGEVLAEEDKAAGRPKPDLVIPVPDSGFPAAIGYARASGVTLENAIIRSHYIGRTFILPDQDSRTHSVRMKLSVIKEVVEGKTVVLVDDSIVRGNTSRIIVDMVREAGAKAVWMRIASPPLAWPCYLGIDTPDREELIINRHQDVEGVCASIGADDLRYISLEGLKAATKSQPFCFGCMTGDYPL